MIVKSVVPIIDWDTKMGHFERQLFNSLQIVKNSEKHKWDTVTYIYTAF